ncbi:MAG TPA: hypothetical protein DGH68_12620 [Bacteroidetes bacterium]|jgi:rhamnogalacturonyl hydrolase YesR|nr:hypothetical protein [Bacteroidota bacterium]
MLHILKRVIFVVVLAISLVVTALSAEKSTPDDSLKALIRSALDEGAHYAITVLLDEQGKARGDYSIIEGKWSPYEPAWHTGQLIYGLLEAYKITQNPEYLEHAKGAGNWWVSLAITDHPKLKGMVKTIHGNGIEKICFATMTDGANGIFELWRISEDEKYASVATTAGEWMLQNMYIPEHKLFYDFVDPTTGEVQKTWSDFWPEKKEQVLTDVARPNNEGYLYRDMYEYTRNEKYKRLFLELCDGLVDKQGPEGLWMEFTPNNNSTGSFHPRFNIWYAESLVKGYEMTGNRKYLDAAKKTLAFYTKFQKKDGTIYYDNNIDGTSKENSPSGSTTSFAGIVWIQLLMHGVGDEFKGNIERSFQWVMSNRYAKDHPDANLAGGFYNLRMSIKNGRHRIVQRDIGTAFGLRFLAEYYRYKFTTEK